MILSDEKQKDGDYPEIIINVMACISDRTDLDPEGLQKHFYEYLIDAENLAKRLNTSLSKSSIVLLISAYKTANPDKELYSRYYL